MGTFSIWHWLIVLIIVMLVFGTKKLGNIGTDLGKAVKGFKDGLKGEEEKSTTPTPIQNDQSQQSQQAQHIADQTHTRTGNNTIDVEAKEKNTTGH